MRIFTKIGVTDQGLENQEHYADVRADDSLRHDLLYYYDRLHCLSNSQVLDLQATNRHQE